MKQIKLSGKKGIGLFALVDDGLFERLNKFTWFFDGRYAGRDEYVQGSYDKTKTPHGKGRRILMHQFIMPVPEGMEVDHKNGNKLDCQTSNLRACTHRENLYNRKKRINCSSKYKGVYWHKNLKKWAAYIKKSHLGLFDNESEAAKAYDSKAVELFGVYAKLNF